MSFAVIERHATVEHAKTGAVAGGTFRNNHTYFAVNFEAPNSGLCAGSAYGSGGWWPDYGGYKGAPTCAPYRTTAEVSFDRIKKKKRQRELKKFRQEKADGSRSSSAPYGLEKGHVDWEPAVQKEPMRIPHIGDRKIDIFRPKDALVDLREKKGRGSFWVFGMGREF